MRKPWHFEDERYFQTTFVRDWEHRGSGWSYPARVSSSCRIKDQTQWNTILVVSLHLFTSYPSCLKMEYISPNSNFYVGTMMINIDEPMDGMGYPMFRQSPFPSWRLFGLGTSAMVENGAPSRPRRPVFFNPRNWMRRWMHRLSGTRKRCGNQQDLNPTKKLITVIYGASGHDVWVWNGLKVFIHTLRKTVPSTCIINKLCHHKWKLQFCRVWTYMEI